MGILSWLGFRGREDKPAREVRRDVPRPMPGDRG